MAGQARSAIDMAVLRSKLLAAKAELADADRSEATIPCEESIDRAAVLVAEAIDMLYPLQDPDVTYPEIDRGPVAAAAKAALEVLEAAGQDGVSIVLLVQTHDAQGRTTGRSAASNIANPQDLLRNVLKNIERGEI